MNNGGAERVMSILVNELHHRGHKVILVNDYQFPNEYHIEPEVEHHYIDGSFENKEGSTWKRNVKRIRFLRRICKARGVDVVLSFISDANFRAILSTLGLKTKNVISVRIDPARAYRSKKKALIAKVLYSIADGCVFQTQKAKNWYPQSIQRHSRVILNPVSDMFYNADGNPGSENRIVTSGRLSMQKRFDVLIEAFSKIHSQFPSYILEIYGEGELKRELQSQIDSLQLQDSAFLKGRSEHIDEDIKNASLFVLSSDFEGLPNSLMEAMALGLPCISTDCDGGGATALINDRKNGIIVKIDDPIGLAESLKEILENDGFRLAIGEEAKKRAGEFKTSVIINKWEQYLEEVCVGKK